MLNDASPGNTGVVTSVLQTTSLSLLALPSLLLSRLRITLDNPPTL